MMSDGVEKMRKDAEIYEKRGMDEMAKQLRKQANHLEALFKQTGSNDEWRKQWCPARRC